MVNLPCIIVFAFTLRAHAPRCALKLIVALLAYLGCGEQPHNIGTMGIMAAYTTHLFSRIAGVGPAPDGMKPPPPKECRDMLP